MHFGKSQNLSQNDDKVITLIILKHCYINDCLIYFLVGKNSSRIADTSLELTNSKWNVSISHFPYLYTHIQLSNQDKIFEICKIFESFKDFLWDFCEDFEILVFF